MLAEANSESYQANVIVHRYKYVYNRYLAALAERGFPGLALFLTVITLSIYLATSNNVDIREFAAEQLSIRFMYTNYLIGCNAKAYYEAKSATMVVGTISPLLLTRISNHKKMQTTADRL